MRVDPRYMSPFYIMCPGKVFFNHTVVLLTILKYEGGSDAEQKENTRKVSSASSTRQDQLVVCDKKQT